MKLFRRTSDWFKYERLHHYPELAGFEPSGALKRLETYEREEYQACQHWLRILWALIGLMVLIWLVVLYYNRLLANGLFFFILVPQWLVQYLLYRRVRRRVLAKVAAELRDGRLWVCIECGYDLRASEERCPECGAPVRVAPPP